jgi:hypothetical protein
LSPQCFVSEFWVLNYKFLLHAVLGLGFRVLNYKFLFLAGLGLDFQFKWFYFANQIKLLMFGDRNFGFEFSSCGFGFRFFNSNVLFGVCQIELLMFDFRILGFELQIYISCGFKFKFSKSKIHLKFAELSFCCLVLKFRVLSFKFLVLAVLGFVFFIRIVYFEFVKLSF